MPDEGQMPDLREVPRAGRCHVEVAKVVGGELTWVRIPAIDTGRWVQIDLVNGQIFIMPPHTPKWP